MAESENLNLQCHTVLEPRSDADNRRKKRNKQNKHGVGTLATALDKINDFTQNEIIGRHSLCKDEFVDTGHWPNQLYIREGRRMIGEYVMRQQDVQTELTKPDVIGMGSYMIDSHTLQRIVNDSGVVENEGNLGEPTTPYQIPYRVILPRRTESTDLLVPVCVSATHVTYSTLRMEPVYMIMGQAAGVAAKLAIDAGVAVQDVDTTALSARLRSQGAVLEWKPPTSETKQN